MFLPNILSSGYSKRGFTLIELMVVMTVIAILATMVLFGLNTAQKAARDAGRQQIMTGIQSALARYYGDNQSYPSANNLCAVINGNTGIKSYLAGEPNDPLTKTGICGGASNGNPCISGDAINCAGGAQYSYSGGGQTYTLSLQKESGGSSIFTNPQ